MSKQLSELLSSYIERNHCTLVEVAESLGCHWTTVWRWKKGVTQPTGIYRERLNELLEHGEDQ